MAIDTPARIAVLGAGPIGLEAALYGRFLGYDVDIYESGCVADNIRRWGHVRMFSPFAMNASSLGLAALAAQDSKAISPPEARDALLTGREYVERYLLPLSQTDLLSDHLHLEHARRRAVQTGPAEGPADRPRPAAGGRVRAACWTILTANDWPRLTWSLTPAARIAHPVAWAPAECRRWASVHLRSAIHYHLPDVLGRDRDQFRGQRTLVVGHGYSAATTVVALAELAQQHPGTEIIWLTRHGDAAPLTAIEHDALPARARLTATANQLAKDSQGPVKHLGDRQVCRVDRQRSRRVCGGSDGNGRRDLAGRSDRRPGRLSARPRHRRGIAGAPCYATEGPMTLAASLLGQVTADCLAPTTFEAQSLLTTEPRYFLLGSKSYGRNSHFLIAAGLDQIRRVFSVLADRHDLNLYANMQHLLP